MRLDAKTESWPIRGQFRIARGAKRTAETVVAEISDGAVGRGESVPYARYGETLDSTLSQIGQIAKSGPDMLDRARLPDMLGRGAARAAIDCALWDYEAKSGVRGVAEGLTEILGPRAGAPKPLTTAFTISLDAADAMGRAAADAGDRPLLKLKLGDADADLDRVRAVRAARPDARLIVDANEGWSLEALRVLAGPMAELGVELVEQPLPAGQDTALGEEDWPILICADESIHDRTGLDGLPGAYRAINIKIDKAGGLTEAACLAAEARERGLALMVGCMVATSLSMAPAVMLAGMAEAEFVDLDGPLLLSEDRPNGLAYRGAVVEPPSPALWG